MNWIKIISTVLFFSLSVTGCGGSSSSSGAPEVGSELRYRGVDASFATQLQTCGSPILSSDASYPWQDYGNVGINLVRLRVWVDPEQGYNNLADTMAKAQSAADAGMALLIDFHYSDTWADPAHQTKPAAWADSDLNTLEQQVYQHTLTVLNALAEENIPVAMVQLGNEISAGMLWDEGRVGGEFNDNWWRLARLINSGVQAVDDSALSDRPLIMIHTDSGGDHETTEWFFSNLLSEGVTFDVIGLSYYSWWQGSLQALTENLQALAANYQQPILLAEIAHPYTVTDHDNQANFVWRETELNSSFPATEQGQADHITALRSILLALPEEKGLGMVYWAPDWMGSDTTACQSSWDNLTLYSNSGRPLAGLVALGSSR